MAKSVRKSNAEAQFPNAIYPQVVNGLSAKDALVVQLVLEVTAAQKRLDPSMIRDVVDAGQEVAYQLGWESRPGKKGAKEIAEEVLGGGA